jgi:hypothetical protein
MTFENHGGPCKTSCERPACMCAHEKLAAENAKLRALIARLEAAEAVVNATIARHGNHGGPGKCATCDALAAWRRAAGK